MTHVQTIHDQISAAVGRKAPPSGEGLLETLFSRLFHGLVYPQIWEDPVADMAALRIAAGDNLVCIASGGCNVMSYLTASPASVTAVDLSPAHVALNRLKLVAAQHLPDHGSFHRFFGLADLPSNVALYDAILAGRLDESSRAYWEAKPLGRRRINMFARGFYRYGVLGQCIGVGHRLARLGGVDFRRLLAAKSLAEQRRFFDDYIDSMFRSRCIRFLARHRASLFGLGIPPAQYDKLAADGGGDVVPVLRERIRKLICDFPIADNYFAWQAFNRGYDRGDTASLPPYLQRGNFDAIRQNAPRVQVLNRALTDVLAEAPAGSKQCYVLLDAQDWMTDVQLNALWQQITRTADRGARVIFRTGGRADILPARVSPRILRNWHYDPDGSGTGFAADRSAIYGGFHLYRFDA